MGPQQDDPNRHRMAVVVSQRYPNAPVPSHMRRHVGSRVDAHGQVIIETDENLSDKEIYPGQSLSQMGKYLTWGKDARKEQGNLGSSDE